MNIKVWSNFSKRKNSTKQPTGGSTITVTLKDQCSILSPVFILNTLDFTINYVEAFGYYYFADVTNLDGNRSEISCTLDYLATFKSQISAYTGFVEYAASSSDVTITDPRNMPSAIISDKQTTMLMSYSKTLSFTGCYLLGVISTTASGDTGVLDYYSLTPAQMASFCAEVNNTTIWDQIKLQFDSVMDSIVSCIWLPFTDVGDSSNPVVIHVGRAALSNVGLVSRVKDRLVTLSTNLDSIAFSSHSGGAGNAMTYLEKPPYATGELYLPFVGMVPLDMDILAYYKQIQIQGYVDVLTGDIAYQIYYGTEYVASYSGNLATKVPVAGASYDGVGVASGILTTIGGVAAAAVAVGSGGSALPAIAAAAGGAMHAAKSSEIHTMINGSNSSAIAARMGSQPFARIIQYEPSMPVLTDIQTELGLPYFNTAVLSSLSGYIKCRDASVDIPGDGAEQDAVNSYLNNGFYLE